MLKKYLKLNETAFACLVLLALGAIVVVFNQQEKRPARNYEMPVLNLPLRYFSDSDISGGYGEGINPSTWASARVDGGYRSFPTTTITLSSDDYSNKKEGLPTVKPLEYIFAKDPSEDVFIFQETFNEQIKEYGVLATRFLPNDTINVQKFDVDGDEENETIVYSCSHGGNHCPHRIMIIKNDAIIFSVSAGLTNLDLVKSEDGNGFYVHWVPVEEDTKWDTGLCCSIGYVSTRFVYENKKFKPVYEQEILYFKVENTEAQE